MKIFYLVTKSEIGGVQVHICQLADYLLSQGDKVAVMSFPGGWLQDRIERIGAKFYPNKFLKHTPNPIGILKAMGEIKRAVSDFKPDLVSCHSTMAGALGRLVIKNKIPTLFTAHGWGFTKGTPIWQRILVFFLEKIAALWSEKIICVSECDRKLALKYGIASKNKIITIHNGVEIVPEQRKEKDYQREKVRIVFVGRLSKQKDPLLLLRAFSELPPELKNKAKIVIIGDGPKREKLENFIKQSKLEEKIKLRGALPREKVFEMLRESDIFVLTSNWEGFPRTILEAMSFGLAIVASDVGGVREAINEDCGILVKRGDKEGLKRALEKLLKNPEIVQKMGEKSRERVEREFSLEKMLRATEQVYQEILFALKK